MSDLECDCIATSSNFWIQCIPVQVRYISNKVKNQHISPLLPTDWLSPHLGLNPLSVFSIPVVINNRPHTSLSHRSVNRNNLPYVHCRPRWLLLINHDTLALFYTMSGHYIPIFLFVMSCVMLTTRLLLFQTRITGRTGGVALLYKSFISFIYDSS